MENVLTEWERREHLLTPENVPKQWKMYGLQKMYSLTAESISLFITEKVSINKGKRTYYQRKMTF